MKKILIALCLFMSLIGASSKSKAFYYYYWWPGMSVPGVLQRYEIGYSYNMMTAKYTARTQALDVNGNLFDSTSKGSITSKGGFGAMAGTTIPVKRVGDKGMLAISVNYMYNIAFWDDVNSLFNLDEGTAGFSLSGATLQMGFPVGADMKWGADAILSRDHRFCYTLGAGAYPALTVTTFNDADGGGFTVSPYVKAEVGVFAGICFKARLMATVGNIDLISNSNKLSSGSADLTMKGTNSVSLSLIFMPFAWSWQRLGWWNTPQY